MRRLLVFTTFLVATAGLSGPALAQSPTTHVVQAGETLFRISRTHRVDIDELRRLNTIEGDYITVGQTLRLVADGAVPPDQTRVDGPRTDVPAVDTPLVETPPASTGRPAAPRGDAHVVEAGETLFRIALRYGLSVPELRRLNGIEGDQIEIGQRLVVSGAARSRPPATPPVAEGPPPETPAGRPASPVRPRTTRPVALSQSRAWSIDATTVPADQVHFSEPGETLYAIAARYGVALEALLAGNALSTAPLPPGTLIRLPERIPPSEAVARTLPEAVADGLALVYPDVMSGRVTSSGEAYDPLTFTASHRTYPFGTLLLVTNPTSGRSTFVRVIDRGPVSDAYMIELSAAAATALSLNPNAAQRVEVREVP